MYISKYLDQTELNKIFGKIQENGEEARMNNRFQFDENNKLVPLFPNETKQNSNIHFRNSSDIQLGKKPCPCMANKVKDTPSS